MSRVGVERLAQLEHRPHVQQVLDHDGELRLPAGGDALHAVGNAVHLGEQQAAFVQQLAGRCGGGGLAPLPVEQQHVECLFHLADAVTQGAGHQIQGTRSRSKTAVFGHRLQHAQVGRAEAVLNGGLRHGSKNLMKNVNIMRCFWRVRNLQ